MLKNSKNNIPIIKEKTCRICGEFLTTQGQKPGYYKCFKCNKLYYQKFKQYETTLGKNAN